MRPLTGLAVWAATWGATVMLVVWCLLAGWWDAALLLAVVAFAPAIWTGQAYDRLA